MNILAGPDPGGIPPEPDRSPSDRALRENLQALCQHALLLDLETSRHGKILKVGAVLADRTFACSGGSSTALEELAAMAGAASCVLGHNLVRHDLSVLRETAPRHPVLRLPVIDTLVL